MSDMIAQTLSAMQAGATQQALQTEMLRQQAKADASVVTLLQNAAEPTRAVLPAGQGGAVDITA